MQGATTMKTRHSFRTNCLFCLVGVGLLLAGLMCPLASSAQQSIFVWGDGGTSPVPAVGLTGVMAIAAGSSYSLAVKSDGSVWAWGDNSYGQLGDGTTNPRGTPVQVLGPNGQGFLTGITAIAAGDSHSLAVKSDGTVFTWGINNHGQLGDGTTSDSSTPVQVVGPNGQGVLTGVVATVAGRGGYSLAVKSDGTVFSWGYNWAGQLGDSTTSDSSTPVQVVGPNGQGVLTGVVAVRAGASSDSLALKSDGTIWAWGDNEIGQLGDGGTEYFSSTPVRVVGLTGVISIGAGYAHMLAVKSDGTVWAWGWNGDGELGDGTTYSRGAPVQVVGPNGQGFLAGVLAVAAGWWHSLALKSDGTVYAWGGNSFGELGDATYTNRNTPAQVLGPNESGSLTGVSAIAAGLGHSLTLASSLPTASISGTITLPGLDNTARPQILTLTLRYQNGDTLLNQTTTLHLGDTFSLLDVPGHYTLHVKGSKWLARNVSVDTTQGDVSGLSLTLVPGDINNDNKVNIFDLGLLADAYNTDPTGGKWNANADLNCDDQVDITDFGLLADSFGKSGDP
jgi:alpha-tubulin suppressor-like RCC1 family protein